MQDIKGLTNDFYSILADRAVPSMIRKDAGLDRKLLKLIDEHLPAGSHDALLLALKSELFAQSDPETALKSAREILSFSSLRPDTEQNLKIKGICHYVVAIATDKLRRFIAPGEDVHHLRKAVEAFPAHWNAAAELADRLCNAGRPFSEIKPYLTTAVRLNDQVSIKARYQQLTAYTAFRSGEDYDAVEYYEKAGVFRPLPPLHRSLLAVACGRLGQYEKALDNFKLAAAASEKRSAKILSGSTVGGIAHPEIWQLAEDAIEDHRRCQSLENTVKLAIVFELLPSPNAGMVCDDIAMKIDALYHNERNVFDAQAFVTVGELNDWLQKRRQRSLLYVVRGEKCRCVAAPSSDSRRVQIALV